MVIKKLLDGLIRKLGKKDYSIDPSIKFTDILILVFDKGICLLRGFCYRIWIRQTGGMLFVGRRCRLKHCHNIVLGKVVTIEDYVEINALSRTGVTIGNNVTIKRNTIIECTGVIRELGEGLVIGNNVGISQNCFIQVRGKVEIGSNVMFGPGVSVFSENHGYANTEIPMISQESTRTGVRIEDDVWVGTRATILDGVTIGKGSIIAAGAVVNQTIPPYSIVGGVPGKILRSRI